MLRVRKLRVRTYESLANPRAGAGDGQQVEQLEVVEAEHVQETRRLTLGILQSELAVELKLRLANRCLDAGNAVGVRSHIVRLGDEGDLVLEVGEAVVDRRGGEHEDARLDALLDNAPHEAVATGLAVIFPGGRLFIPNPIATQSIT